MRKYIILSLLLFFFTVCSVTGQAVASTESTAEKKPFTLLFFLDPNGGPCQLQDNILRDMANELQQKVDIQYILTTIPAHRDIFYHYGIRALPTLLLADVNGKEIKRMPPGVKRSDDVRLLIQSIPQS